MANKFLNLLINLIIKNIFYILWSRFLLIILIPYQLVKFF